MQNAAPLPSFSGAYREVAARKAVSEISCHETLATTQHNILGMRCFGETGKASKAMDLRSQMMLQLRECKFQTPFQAENCVTPSITSSFCNNNTTRHDKDRKDVYCGNPSEELNAYRASRTDDAAAVISARFATSSIKQASCGENLSSQGVFVRSQEFAEASGVSPPVYRSKEMEHDNPNRAEETEDSSTDIKRTSSSASEQEGKVSTTSSGTKRSRNSDVSSKVRSKKEKLGERVIALQQLICPFGKTDTASVLQQVERYIDFLQNQIKVLSSPYLDGGSGKEDPKNGGGLRSRGLCLMPVSVCSQHISSMSNAADFWAPETSASRKS